MPIWTVCEKCGRPKAATDHDDGCPYVIKLWRIDESTGVTLYISEKIAPLWWKPGALVELSVENYLGKTALIITHKPEEKEENKDEKVLSR